MKKRFRSLLNLALCVCFLLFTAAKCVRVSVSPENPKQGDNVNFVITANESSSLTKVEYTIGSNTGSTTVVPKTITINTCKSTGVYYTTISYSAKAYYKDGTIKSTSGSIDLTVGKNIREDTDKTYVTYIADEGDGTINDVRSGWANAFQDEFDAYTETQYYWSQPAFFTTSSLYYVNSADMAIFLGHGSPHQYRAGPNGSDWVDFTNASYGMFAPCYQVGDLEYLVTGSCQVLSMANIGTNGWRFFWNHTNSTKNNDRVFTGLHLVCGFRTNHHYNYWWWFGWHSSSTDFFDQFAESLDDGATIRDAWLDSAGDNLSFDDGNNRTAVFYLPCFENDRISSYTSDDYIFGHPNYSLWAEYWE